MASTTLAIPIASGRTLDDILREVSGLRPDGTAPATPLWEWDMLTLALEQAIGRYSSALQGGLGLEARIAVGEALWWIAAADEFLRLRVSGLKPRPYYSEVAKTKEGERLSGLVFLRNRAGHQLATALEVQSSPVTVPYNVRDADGTVQTHHLTAKLKRTLAPHDRSPLEGFFFHDLSRLPPADPRFTESFGRDACYAATAAGRNVGEVLQKVSDSLRDVLKVERPSPGKVSVVISAQI